MHFFSIQSGVWEPSNPSEANIKIQHFQQSNGCAELSGLDGEPIEFLWNVFPGVTSIDILRQIQRDVNVRRINSDHFEAKAFVFLKSWRWRQMVRKLQPRAGRKKGTSKPIRWCQKTSSRSSLSKSDQCLIWCIFWTHARSGIYWREFVYFKIIWKAMTTAGSNQDTRSGGELMTGTFWEVRNDHARRTSSHWTRRGKSHQMWTMDLDGHFTWMS